MGAFGFEADRDGVGKAFALHLQPAEQQGNGLPARLLGRQRDAIRQLRIIFQIRSQPKLVDHLPRKLGRLKDLHLGIDRRRIRRDRRHDLIHLDDLFRPALQRYAGCRGITWLGEKIGDGGNREAQRADRADQRQPPPYDPGNMMQVDKSSFIDGAIRKSW